MRFTQPPLCEVQTQQQSQFSPTLKNRDHVFVGGHERCRDRVTRDAEPTAADSGVGFCAFWATASVAICGLTRRVWSVAVVAYKAAAALDGG